MKKLGQFYISEKSLNQFIHQDGKKEKNVEDKLSNHINKLFTDISELIIKYKKKKCKNIIDIGCGLSFVNGILSKNLNKTIFYNLDKYDNNGVDHSGKYHENSDDFKTRCDVEITKQFHIDNDIDISRQVYLDSKDIDTIKDVKFDIILSVASWCYHYSFETYENIVKNNTTDNTIFLLRIRSKEKKNILNKFKKYNFEIVNEEYLKEKEYLKEFVMLAKKLD